MRWNTKSDLDISVLRCTQTARRFLILQGKQIPRALVNNPDVVNAIAISPNQIQLSGLKPGVTEINLWDENEELYSIDLVVYGNAKELELSARD